jgi:membrane fusion protein, epimerase transport system
MTDANKTLKPYQVDERRFRHIGIIIIVVVFGGFGLWAALAPLSSAALAPGVVTVESYSKTVQHLEGGIVKNILVRDGDNVEKDQTLIVLDDTQPKAQLEILNGQQYIALAKEARLLAQQTGANFVTYPETLRAHASDPRVKEAIEIQNNTFSVVKKAFEGQISLYRRQIEQLGARVKGMQSQRNSKEKLASSFRNELEDYNALMSEGYAEKQRVREFERNLAQNEGERGELTSGIAETELEIAETELKILQLNKDLQRDVAKEYSEVQSQLFELRERIQSLQDTVVRTVIKAPEAGMVMGLSIHTLGAVIPPGGKLLDIVPQGKSLIVEAKVAPLDIDRVHVGQSAEIRFSAFKSRSTPKIDGTLIALSADRMVNEKSPTQESYYLARVAITAKGIKSLLDADLKLLPGMPAEVLIHTGDRTMLQYLADPLKDTIARSFIED